MKAGAHSPSGDEFDLVPANPWVPRLLTAIATVLLGTGGWLCTRSRPTSSTPTPATTKPMPTSPQTGGPDYVVEAPSWDSDLGKSLDKPQRELTEAEREQQEFVARAAEQWRGVEIFVRKR